MQQYHRTIITLCAIIAMSLSLGCGSKSDPSSGASGDSGGTGGGKKGHVHNHPDEGIHGGPIAEWGKEEFHPELILDTEKKRATVYILDGEVKKQVPIDAQTITLVLKANKPPTTIQLKAQPDEDDPAGKSSRFVGTHEQFGSKLDVEQIHVIGKVKDKPYQGAFHDHSDEQNPPPSDNIKSEKVKP